MTTMKYILVIVLLLASVLLKAQWVEGKITFNNGQTKVGYVKNIVDAKAAFIEYKKSLKDKAIQIGSNELFQVQLNFPDGNTLVAKYIQTIDLNRGGEFMVSKSKSWLRLVYIGDFDVLSYFTEFTNNSDYYINWPGEDSATMIYIKAPKASNAEIIYQLLKKSVAVIFKDKCDYMIESMDEGSFKPLQIEDILHFYTEQCKSTLELQAATKQ